MMPVQRHRTPRWFCANCRHSLGRIHTNREGRTYLTPSERLMGVLHLGGPDWQLVCTEGHTTRWSGDGIRWFEKEQDAA